MKQSPATRITKRISAKWRYWKKRLRRVHESLRGLPPVTGKNLEKETLIQCLDTPNPVLLEIGCNDGSHTLQFLEWFEKPTIYCFEPDPRALARFKDNVGSHPSVEVFETALSNQPGAALFHPSEGVRDEAMLKKLPGGWDQSGSLLEPRQHHAKFPWIHFSKPVKVPCTTLDAWSAEHCPGPIDFIWMDVQGAERKVIEGGQDTLRRTRYLYTEYSNDQLYEGQPNLERLLDALKGFEVVQRYHGDILLKNRTQSVL